MVHIPTSVLKNIAVFGGVFALGSAYYMTEKIQERFRKEDYYRIPMKMLRQYQPAVEAFGQPIVSKRLDLGDTQHNRVDGLNASLLIPVKGPKDKGSLYIQASRLSGKDSWAVDQLDLELKSTGQRWTFYQKPVEDPSS
ncbi:uncharacterized protein LOC124142995 [Haliotis rufescens]|uniref:uncharacterized protein LOC124142995 n=1 Tax=Haliotis rufescens TaxID=6454 RepID=UPI00201F88AF|nr:uncharacterized protein LOC124142995 [Haliotis rufescens]